MSVPKTLTGTGAHPSGHSWLEFIADAEIFEQLLEKIEWVMMGHWRGSARARIEFTKKVDWFFRFVDKMTYGEQKVDDESNPPKDPWADSENKSIGAKDTPGEHEDESV